LALSRGLAHFTNTELVLMRQTQHFANLPHRHPLLRHRLAPLFLLTGGADQLIRVSMGAMLVRSSPAVRNHYRVVRPPVAISVRKGAHSPHPVCAEVTKHNRPGCRSPSCPAAVFAAVGTTRGASKLGGRNITEYLHPRNTALREVVRGTNAGS